MELDKYETATVSTVTGSQTAQDYSKNSVNTTENSPYGLATVSRLLVNHDDVKKNVELLKTTVVGN